MQPFTDLRYYVYLHFHPETGEIVYVGKGSGGRAWDTTRSRKGYHPEHYKWILDLLSRGYVPSNYVEIVIQNLSQKEAFESEKGFMHGQGQPKFNRTCGERNHKAKLTDKQARNIYVRVWKGERAQSLAEEFGVSKAAIYHIKKGTQWKAATASIRN